MKKDFFIILDNIRSRENVGSIFRTADGAGVSKIYLCGITPTPPHEKISKTALGAEKCIPWEYQPQTYRCLLKIKNQSASRRTKIKIVGLEKTKSSKNIFKYKVPKNTKIALVLGNEVKGLSSKILKYCDEVVYIPMYGRKESLNVSVAFGFAVYQLIK